MYVITTLSILLVVSIYQYSLPQPSIQAIEKQDEQFGWQPCIFFKKSYFIPIHTPASMLKVFIEVVTILHFLTSVQWL